MTSVVRLRDLHALAKTEAKRRRVKPWQAAFEDVGLLLFQRATRYWCTPKNTATFATTGGDGVHYGFLRLSDRELESGPVVMTVPMNGDEPNVIVGRDLHDFLCLGLYQSWFVLEQLVYDHRRSFVKDLLRKPTGDDTWPEKDLLLALFPERFHLKPWKNVGQRLAALKRRWLRELVVAPPP